jgi:hypothetical protein
MKHQTHKLRIISLVTATAFFFAIQFVDNGMATQELRPLAAGGEIT